MVEIADIDGHSQIKVNYFTKYSRLDRQIIMGDDNFIKFISSIAYYFDTPNIVIYADFMSCDKLKIKSKISRTSKKNSNKKSNKKSNKNSNKNPDDVKIEMYNHIIKEKDDHMNLFDKIYTEKKPVTTFKKKQRTYMKLPDKPYKSERQTKSSKKQPLDPSSDTCNVNITGDEEIDVFTGGSYCLDFYKYLKYNEKRYETTNTLNVELQPKFSYHDLDLLKSVSPTKILKKEDRDEIYQIYVKNYVLESSTEQDNLADFYIWMIENKCYLMDIFIKKMDKLYRDDNPFKKGMYVLDAMAYLYNRRYVNTYSRYIKMVIDEEHQLLTLPRNDYRIRR